MSLQSRAHPMSSPPATALASWRTLAGLASGQAAVFIAFVPVLSYLLPLQAQAVAPDGKVALLSQAALWGCLAGGSANIVFGALSDRFRARLGGRRVWILLGLAVTLVAYTRLEASDSAPGLIAAVVLFQTGLNTMFGPLAAMLPDLVPDRQKGAASALLGAAQPIAMLFTSVVVAGLIKDGGWRYAATAAAVLAATTPMLWVAERAASAAPVPQPESASAPSGALRSPDVGTAFLSRLLVQVAVALNSLYLLYAVQHQAAAAAWRDPGRVDHTFGMLLAVWTGAALVAGLVGGFWSDRIGVRKPFIVASGFLLAGGLALMAAAPAWPGPLIAQALFGAGLGLYATVDLALIAQILPRPDRAGRDLGLINIANVAPQIAAPVLGLALAGAAAERGFGALYGAAALFALIGGALIVRVRGVR